MTTRWCVCGLAYLAVQIFRVQFLRLGAKMGSEMY